MSIWLDIARGAAVGNVLLLIALSSVWLPNYCRHRAKHTLSLLVFAGFLLLQNLLWIYFYFLVPYISHWFRYVSLGAQAGVAGLCGLEFFALLFLLRITWQ